MATRPPPDERRPVTILFADLVGSTALAEQFDPEDWKEIVAPVLARFAAIIEEHDGHVAQLLGDGLLAFFGAPVAHEDDPIRAVGAGLALVDSLALPRAGRIDGGPQLQVRVGINSGEVVVGGMGREGRREYLAVGDAVNVAARLQAAAAPMTVLVAEETYRRVEDAVEALERGPLQLKGKALPIRAREIVQIHDRRSRGRASRHAAALTGREDELAALVAAAANLGQRGGVIVRITGEPGIGKSRLLAEWHEALAAGPADGTDDAGTRAARHLVGGGRQGDAADWVVVACRTGGPELSRDLVTALVRELLGISEALDADSVRHAFDARVAGLLAADGWLADAAAPHLRAVSPTSDDLVPLLAWLLDLPLTCGEREALAGLEGRPRQRRAGEALGLLLRLRCRERPLVLVIEDCHWLDPSSAELLAVATEGLAALPLCFCWTRRPDLAPAVVRLESVLEGQGGLRRVEISLVALGAGEQEQLAERLLDGGIPDGLRRLVAERCEGNPLFVEELIAVLVDRGRLHRDATGAWTLATTDVTEIPPGIHGLLVTRLDRLPPPVRRFALIGSVIGRTMSAATVQAIAVEAGDSEVVRLADPVAQSAGLLVRADDRISFRHALVHDAAYGLLTKAERRRLHGLAGRHLEAEAVAEGRLPESAAALARQFFAAEAYEPAARHARTAAERADADCAIDEAIALYGIAADSLRTLVRTAGATPTEPLLRDLRASLDRQGFCLKLRGRLAESDAARDEAYTLLPPGPSIERAVLLGHRSDNAAARHDYDIEESLLLEAERTLDAISEPRDADWWHAWITVRSSRVGFAYWLNRSDEILPLLESLGGPVRDHGTADQKAEHEHSWVMYIHRRDAFAPSEEVMAHVRAAYDADLASGRRDAIAWAEFMLGFSQLFNRETQPAVEHLQLALAAGPGIGDDLLVARSATYLAFALRLARRFDAMAEVNERALAASRRLGIDQYVAIGLGNIACLRLRSGDAPGARAAAGEGDAAWPASPPNPLRMAITWPAIGADVELGDCAGAISRVPALLEPGQWPPDPPVADALRTVLAADATDRHDLLLAVLDRAHQAGYF